MYKFCCLQASRIRSQLRSQSTNQLPVPEPAYSPLPWPCSSQPCSACCNSLSRTPCSSLTEEPTNNRLRSRHIRLCASSSSLWLQSQWEFVLTTGFGASILALLALILLVMLKLPFYPPPSPPIECLTAAQVTPATCHSSPPACSVDSLI
jgi:hypothetical protein